MDTLNDLRILADECLARFKTEKYEIIKEMLSDDKCFFTINSNTALAILEDLGLTEEEANETYKRLISPESYEKIYKKVIVK